jgi:predicted P-loop ATPase
MSITDTSRITDTDRLEPDREALGLFINLMFKRASPDGYISLRLFPDKGSQEEKAIDIEAIRVGDKDLLGIAVIRARQAATWHEPAVFCPPVATFKNHQSAKTDNLCEGPCLSVECDQSPCSARVRLEILLGPATAVVASGGEWTNPATGEIEPKVHLHWRLKKPTSTRPDHALLYEARALATTLIGGDTTNKSIVHPIRWPGSVHRKGTPRLAKIVASSDDNEINLADAVERLRDAAGTLDFKSAGVKSNGNLEAADHATVAAALAVIPNDTLEWDDWNKVGMATWAATGGSEVGREAFATWSAKSKKNNPAATEARWQHYKTSPPTKVGFGTLIHLARKHSPGWTYGSKPVDPADIEIARLAKMRQLDYEREREAVAAKLGIRKPVLDKMVQAKRKQNAADEAEAKRLQAVQARQATGEPEWRERYHLDGSPRPSMHNARLAITALGVVCSYDTFHNKILFGYADDGARHALESIIGEVSDNGIIALRQLMSDRFGFDLEDNATRDAVKSLALEHCFDPVADMLAEAEVDWDGVERLDEMAVEYFNCENTPLNRACVRKTMIAAVARVRNPGCKFDTITVLEAQEGWNKSTAWRVLAGDENFSDEPIIGKNSREVQEHLAAVWIHENAELAGMKKAEVETVKAFASRQVDRARPAFGHFLTKQPRHSIEVGTTNSDEYHQSQTGNRRFWGMKVLKSIDLEKLQRDRLLLWGEAAHNQSKGESLTIDEAMWPDAGVEQEKRRVKHPWEDILAKIPNMIEKKQWDDEQERYTVTETIPIIHIEDGKECVASAVILTHVLELPKAYQTPNHSMRLAEVMKRLGWERNDGNKITINGEQVRGYFRPVEWTEAKGFTNPPPKPCD